MKIAHRKAKDNAPDEMHIETSKHAAKAFAKMKRKEGWNARVYAKVVKAGNGHGEFWVVCLFDPDDFGDA